MQKTTISIDAVPEAAVLAEPVLDVHHQVLLAAGTLLSPGKVDNLRQRGVATLVIVGAAAADAPQVDTAAQQAQRDERLQHLFRHALRTGQVNPLQHMVARYRQGEFA